MALFKKWLTVSQASQVIFELLENADPAILTQDLDGYDIELIQREIFHLNIFTILNVLDAQEKGTWRQWKPQILKGFSDLILPPPPLTEPEEYQNYSEQLKMREFSYFNVLSTIPGIFETVALLSPQVSKKVAVYFATLCGNRDDINYHFIGEGAFLTLGRSLQQIINDTRIVNK